MPEGDYDLSESKDYMVLLNGKDQKIKNNSISTELLDKESDHKAEAADQIRYQFRNCLKKRAVFSVLHQTQTSTRHRGVGSQASLFIELLVLLS